MWPCLMPPGVCNTPCKITLTVGEGEDCTPVVAATLKINCNWQDSPRQILNADRQLIQLGGTAYFSGDIAPEVNVLAGTVEIYGVTWTIHKGAKCRNPDGTVNYTKMELM